MSRRWKSAAEALLLVGAAAMAGAADAPATAGRFDPPPDRPMLLSRTLTRELADGKAIVAVRRYRIAFHRTEAGWRVEGELVASEIEAPPALAAIAAIERARSDDGLFPILLDGAGRIVGSGGDGAQGRGAVERAVTMGAARVGEAPPGREFLTEVQAAAARGGLTRWPETLFLPGEEHREEAREVALPDGSTGVVRVALDRASPPGAATMARAERIVTTELGQTRRVARESWALAPG